MTDRCLTLDISQLRDLGGACTAQEIAQQPALWPHTFMQIEAVREDIDAFLAPLLAKESLRIIFTGAGTSAFIGQIIASYLTRQTGRRFETISSTSLVACPEDYFSEQTPTLLVSFARSGNSPESLGALELASQLLPECAHLVLTCNAEGQLAEASCQRDDIFCLLMPEETNDKGFAMTSSFSNMLLSALCIFDNSADNGEKIRIASNLAEQLIEGQAESIKTLAQLPCERVVYLGSGCLKGLAQEAALKLQELTAGQVVAMHESSLGVRHGLKSIINNKTIVFQFMAVESHARQYDSDLFEELCQDDNAMKIIGITDEVIDDCDCLLALPEKKVESIWLSFPFIVLAQMFAFFKSIELGITPDNPFPSGEINRVVQGVTVYPYSK